MTGSVTDDGIEWLPRGVDYGVRIGRASGRVVVEWRGIGRLTAASGADPVFASAEGVDETRLDKFRATSLLACRRYLAGDLSLHGSAVGLPHGAIALIGESGAGKSTIAMALVEHQGATFVADDVVPVDWLGSLALVEPVDDSFWLTEDALGWFGVQPTSIGKRACVPRLRASTAERLRAIVHLTFDESVEDVKMDALLGHETFVVLSRAQLCYPTGDEDEALRNLELRARVARCVPVFRLSRPRSPDGPKRAAQLLAQRFGEALPAEGRA